MSAFSFLAWSKIDCNLCKLREEQLMDTIRRPFSAPPLSVFCDWLSHEFVSVVCFATLMATCLKFF